MAKSKPKAATANIHAVVGSDEAEVKRVAAELASNLTPPGAGDFGLEIIDGTVDRSEERRVGKECRSRWSPYH